MMGSIGFSTVIGHQKAIGQLRAAAALNRIAHAYLFIGGHGVGKRTLARAFAAYLLCLSRASRSLVLRSEAPLRRVANDGNRGESQAGAPAPHLEDACGVCPSCRKFLSGSHPDFVELMREKTYYLTDQVRDLTKRCMFAPYESEMQVLLIPDAEWLYHVSANSLLKTLEEPGGSAIFLLTTSAPNQMLPTVLSRCQRLVLGAPDHQEAADMVAEKLSIDPNQAEILLRMFHGSPGKALAAKENLYSQFRLDLADSLATLGDAPENMNRLFELLESEEADLDEALWLLRTLLSDAAILGLGSDRKYLTHPDLADKLSAYSSRYDPRQILEKIRNLDIARLYILRNANRNTLSLAIAAQVATKHGKQTKWRMIR